MLAVLFCFYAGFAQWRWLIVPTAVVVMVVLHVTRWSWLTTIDLGYGAADVVAEIAILTASCFAAYFIGGLIPHYRAARRRRLAGAADKKRSKVAGN